MKFRTRYSEPYKVAKSFEGEESRTKQSFKDECDINNLMARYEKTGQLPALAAAQPQYGDFADVPTFMEACQIVQKAEEQFAALPAEVRAECANNPAIFLQAIQDPAWAIKHKLALPPSVVPDPDAGGQPAPPPSPAKGRRDAPKSKPSDTSDDT